MPNENKVNNGKGATEDKKAKEEQEKKAQAAQEEDTKAAQDKDAKKTKDKKIKVTVIQELINQVDELKTAIENAGEEGRTKVKCIKVDDIVNKVPTTPDGHVDPDRWSKLTEADQSTIHQSLEQVRDSLHAAGGFDGPSEPKHIMYADYAPNGAIYLLALFGLLIPALLLFGIVSNWNQATGMDCAMKTQEAIAAIGKLDTAKAEATKAEAAEQVKLTAAEVKEATEQMNTKAVEAIKAISKGGVKEDSVLLMVIMTGALGGSLHLLRSLVEFVGNRKLMRSWILYYLSMPITGAGLASIIYMLVRIGYIGPLEGSADTPAITNQDLIGIYALAAMTGLFARTALDKLNQVFSTIVGAKSVTEAKGSKDTLQS